MKKIISALGTITSIVSLAFINNIPQAVRICFFLFGIGAFGYLVYDDFFRKKENEIVCKNEKQIKDTMLDLIKRQGKVCIMSRDLSWVDDEILSCMHDKTNSILIFAQNENETTKSLIDAGVDIKFYGHLNYEPKTRFTVIRYNRNDPQVAIAKRKDKVSRKREFRHTIYQTENGNSKQDDWINSLAIDMINLCNTVSRGSEQNEDNRTEKSTKTDR